MDEHIIFGTWKLLKVKSTESEKELEYLQPKTWDNNEQDRSSWSHHFYFLAMPLQVYDDEDQKWLEPMFGSVWH